MLCANADKSDEQSYKRIYGSKVSELNGSIRFQVNIDIGLKQKMISI